MDHHDDDTFDQYNHNKHRSCEKKKKSRKDGRKRKKHHRCKKHDESEKYLKSEKRSDSCDSCDSCKPKCKRYRNTKTVFRNAGKIKKYLTRLIVAPFNLSKNEKNNTILLSFYCS